MSFSENLRKIRKEKGISQEELAELLGVSRQAVSKWEQGDGYPEVEKLLLIANQLNISLDCLMSMEIAQVGKHNNQNVSGSITISSPHEHVIATCNTVNASGNFKGGKNAPHYALFAVRKEFSFWGQPTLFLGWYANEEAIAKEMAEIQNAIATGVTDYELKYSVKVEIRWWKRQIINEDENICEK